MSLRNDVLAALGAASEPLTPREVREALGLEQGDNSANATLSQLLAKGKIARIHVEGQSRYTLAEGVKPPPRSTEPAATKPKANGARKRSPGSVNGHDPLARAEQAQHTLKALEISAKASQDALDTYLRAIADTNVVEPLLAARDGAREALRHYVCDTTRLGGAL